MRCALLALVALVGLPLTASAQTIVLDPGHGGHDPGAVGCGIEEEDVVLDIALRTRDLLRADGYTVHMTRTDDRFISLSGRSSFSNDRGASRFVSIHANANAGTPATGTETFVYTSASSTSRDLGGKLQSEMISAWGLRDRGLKFANFSVIRRTAAPAALTETGFINNCGIDSARLANPSRRQEMAVAHYRAIVRSFGRTPGSPAPAPAPEPEPEPTPGGGRVLGVAFEDTGAGLEDTSRRLTDATARLRETGASVRVDGSGLFRFDVPNGTYTVEVSASGYATATRSCTVSGGDAWCSVGLTEAAAPTTGTARGVIFEDTGAGFADTSRRLAGASVRVRETGASTSTDSRGNWTLSLPAGGYTIDVNAAGFATASRTCEVRAGGEAWCSVGVARAAAAGTLQGVLYRGTVSRRVTGANVRVVETGASATSRGTDGYWSFELSPGTYTVEASGVGLSTVTRRCTVESRRDTWCSIDVPASGRGGGEELLVETDPEDDTVAMDPSFDGETGARGELGAVGCAAGGAGGQGGALLFLVLLMGGLRRRVRRGLTVGGVAVLAACGGQGESAEAIENVDQEVEAVETVEVANVIEAFATVVDVQVITQGDWADITISPDGQRVALSHPALAGLSVAELDDAASLRAVHLGRGAGLAPLWRADGRALGIRTPGQTSTAVPTLAFEIPAVGARVVDVRAPLPDLQAVAPIRAAAPRTVRVHEGLVEIDPGPGVERVGPPGDQYFAPRVSPDGEWVSFEGLSTGLYLHHVARGETVHLGAGAHARFDARSRFVVFERVTDDGHEVTSGDLMIADLAASPPEVTTLLEDTPIDRAPDIAGDTLVFLRDDQAMRATLRLSR